MRRYLARCRCIGRGSLDDRAQLQGGREMKTHRFASHTAEEKRRLSNLGHLIEGLLLATVGILAILGNVGIAT